MHAYEHSYHRRSQTCNIYGTHVYLNRTVDDCRQQIVCYLWAVIGNAKHVPNVGDLRELRLSFMRKVLHKERLKGGWKGRDKDQEMPQEVMYAVVDGAPSEGRR